MFGLTSDQVQDLIGLGVGLTIVAAIAGVSWWFIPLATLLERLAR